MKSLPLVCLLVFGVIINNAVLAKEICTCVPFEGIGDADQLHRLAMNNCKPKFYCYNWAVTFYCEVPNGQMQVMEDCCKANAAIQKVFCKEISDESFTSQIEKFMREYLG